MAETPASNPVPQGPGESPVSERGYWGLAAYLLVVVLFIFWGLYRSWPLCESATSETNANSNQAARANINRNENVSTNRNLSGNGNQNSNTGVPATGNVNRTQTDTGNTNRPRLKVLSVSPGSGPVKGDTRVTIRGNGFKENAKVTFGGVPADTVEDVTDDTITARTPPHDSGKVDVAVANPGDATDLLASGYTYACSPVPDSQLLLLVLLAGALGGTIHALRSLWWYVGNRELVRSWVLMYILLPFNGAAIAAVFFLIIRGGFMSSAPEGSATMYIVGIAVLTGFFSEQAALKLRDIANAVLTKPGKGEDSRPQTSEPPGSRSETQPPGGLPVSGITPDKGPTGQEVKIIGVNLSSVKSVTFGGVPAEGVAFDPANSTVTAKAPPQPQPPAGPVDVVVTDDKGKAIKLKFTYE